MLKVPETSTVSRVYISTEQFQTGSRNVSLERFVPFTLATIIGVSTTCDT